jgi:thioredoxin 1
VLEQTAEELGEKIKIAKVNVDLHGELASNYGVTALPTVLFFVNGEVKDQQIGLVGSDVFVSKVEALI